jgi:hypothetical protein
VRRRARLPGASAWGAATGLVVVLALAGLGTAQVVARRGVRTKTSFLLPDAGYTYTLEDPDDRDKLRTLFHGRTILFANKFVKSLKDGSFRPELQRVAEIGGGTASEDKLHDYLEGLEPIPDSMAQDGQLTVEGQQRLKKIQLAWALVQLVRYGAPGFRATFDVPGVPGAFDEFLESAQLDVNFLARIREFENEYESFVEVESDGRVAQSGEMTQDQIIDMVYAEVRALVDAGEPIAAGTRPPDGLLRDLAVTVVERYLTNPDHVWRIRPQWYDFAEASDEVEDTTSQNFLSSGFQIMAWSMPRVNFDDPDEAIREMGTAYRLKFKADGWKKMGGPGSSFSSSWSLSAANGVFNSTDPTGWVTGSGPEVKIFEKVEVVAEPLPMKVLDQSLVHAGLEGSPDELSVEELIRTYWKTLEAFDNPPGNLDAIGDTISAPGATEDILPGDRFSESSEGGSFP